MTDPSVNKLLSNSSGYRPEIDGLRALAVLAVIFNHIDKSLLPNGFLGVDVFFVISGFVITSSLSSLPYKMGGAFLCAFFARRMRRLLPVLALCVLVTGVLVCYVDPKPTASLTTGIFALFGFSNFFLLSNAGDYFARAAEANAFTQTWSLGVEEQFYFVFPILVWVSGYLRLPSGYRHLTWTVAILSILSLTGYFLTDSNNPVAAFYLMPTRFWELGVGCLLYMLMSRFERRHFVLICRNESFLYAILLIIVFLLPQRYTALATVASVALSLLLIATSAPGTTFNTVLNFPLLQYIGKISYSLYLWHWTVLAISRWLVGDHLILAPFLLGFIFLLSSFSYHLVEKPVRFSSLLGDCKRVIVLGFSLSFAVSLILIFLNFQHGSILRTHLNDIEQSPGFLPLKGSGLPYDPTCVVDGHRRPLNPETFDQCTVLPRRGEQTVWALGDSHAGHLQGLLYALHEKTGLGVHLIETPGISFPLGSAKFQPREIIFDKIISRAKPGDIILVSRLFLDRTTRLPLPDLPEWGGELDILAKEIGKKGLKLVLIGPPPIFRYEDVNSCYFSIFGFNSCTVERTSISSNVDRVIQTLLKKATGGHVYIFNSFVHLCPESNRDCSPVAGERFLFRDKDHLNAYGSASLVNPFISFLVKKNLIVDESSVWASTYRTLDLRLPKLDRVETHHLSDAEAWGRWTNGSPVEFRFAEWIPKKFRMKLSFDRVFGPNDGENFEVQVGEQVRNFIGINAPTSVLLDFDNVPQGVDTISIVIPRPTSPKELGASNDQRKLGLGIVSLEISPLD